MTELETTDEIQNMENKHEVINKELQDAIEDFINGKGGSERPKYEHCHTLINYYKPINDKIVECFKREIECISIMPYGEEIIFAINPMPICIGNLTTVIKVENSCGKSMNVYFDRN